jgi:hypothetical protein
LWWVRGGEARGRCVLDGVFRAVVDLASKLAPKIKDKRRRKKKVAWEKRKGLQMGFLGGERERK